MKPYETNLQHIRRQHQSLDSFRVDVRMLTQHLPALRHVLVACAAFPGVIANEPGPDYGVTATFSIVAVDPDTGV